MFIFSQNIKTCIKTSLIQVHIISHQLKLTTLMPHRHFFCIFSFLFAIICVEKRGIGENEHIVYFVDSKAY